MSHSSRWTSGNCSSFPDQAALYDVVVYCFQSPIFRQEMSFVKTMSVHSSTTVACRHLGKWLIGQGFQGGSGVSWIDKVLLCIMARLKHFYYVNLILLMSRAVLSFPRSIKESLVANSKDPKELDVPKC